MTQPPVDPPEGQPDSNWNDDLPDPVEPTDDELYGRWPDEDDCGPPVDVNLWLARLSPAEREAVFEGGIDVVREGHPETMSACAGFGDGGPLDEMLPGPILAVFTQNVIDSGFSPLSDDELVGVLRAARRLSSWQAALELRAITELDARRLRDSGRPGASWVNEHTSSELAAALTLTGRAADRLLGVSRDLARLSAVLRALAAGRIDRARAEVFAYELGGLSEIAAAAVAIGFCDLAGSMTTGQLRAALRSMVLSLDPAALKRRAEKARADARVETWREGSGNAALAGRELAPADAIAADRRIAAIAKALKEAGAPGRMDQLRAAVYIALLTGRDPETLHPAAGDGQGPLAQPSPPGQSGSPAPGQSGSPAPGQSGSPAPGQSGSPAPGHSASVPPGPALTGSVNLTMPVSAWLGCTDRPGEVAGLGPIDAYTCRDLAARLTAGPGTRWCVTRSLVVTGGPSLMPAVGPVLGHRADRMATRRGWEL